MANRKKFEISLKEIKEVLNVEAGEEDGGWDETLSFRDDGIYLREIGGTSMMLTPVEKRALYGAKSSFNELVLTFPCDLEDFERFVQRYGLYGSVDPFALAECLVGQLNGPARSKQFRRETAIIDELDNMGLDPMALPKQHGPGQPGVKARVWSQLKSNPVFATQNGSSKKAFDKAWDALSKERRIAWVRK